MPSRLPQGSKGNSNKDQEDNIDLQDSPSSTDDEDYDDYGSERTKRRRANGQEKDNVDRNIEKNKITLTTVLNYHNYCIWWKDVDALFVALECEM